MTVADASIADPTARLPAGAAADLAYVTAEFTALEPSRYALVQRGVLPRATYVLPDGTAMVPVDHAALLDDAGGDPAQVAARFVQRFVAAGGARDDAESEHVAWLTGDFGACLYETSPEMIVAKGSLMAAIAALLARPAPDRPRWAAALRRSVDALDAVERPFTAWDRERWGPVSRDRLIAGPRERFAQVWS